MLLLPDIGTTQLDPFRAAQTLNVNCFVHDPFTREPYSRDPRNVARLKRESETAPLSIRTQPMEFELYFDC
jgi:glutamine synthetase